VPIPPELVAILRWHIAEFGVAPDGRLFRQPNGRDAASGSLACSTPSRNSPSVVAEIPHSKSVVGSSTYSQVWQVRHRRAADLGWLFRSARSCPAADARRPANLSHFAVGQLPACWRHPYPDNSSATFGIALRLVDLQTEPRDSQLPGSCGTSRPEPGQVMPSDSLDLHDIGNLIAHGRQWRRDGRRPADTAGLATSGRRSPVQA
jgi:hypothetical protein